MEGLIASAEAEFHKIEGEVASVFHHTEAAVVADVHTAEADVKKVEVKIETVAKEAFDAVANEVKKLRAEFDALLKRIENHNSKGGAI
jgi:ElaB/YqjD/DUF883 family membrane-anchored ribosome-binding protein